MIIFPYEYTDQVGNCFNDFNYLTIKINDFAFNGFVMTHL